MVKMVNIRQMTETDLTAADQLRSLVGWNQTLKDWRRLLSLQPHGCFVTEQDGNVVGTVTTTYYGSELAWVGMLLVHPDYRKQGIGGELMKQAMDYLGALGVICTGLDATPAGETIYRKLGFQPRWGLARWEITSLQNFPPYNYLRVRCLESENDLDKIINLDRITFGVNRAALLKLLVNDSLVTYVITGEGRTITGFGMVRAGSKAYSLGPLVAIHKVDAEEIITALLKDINDQPCYWDIPGYNLVAAELAGQYGFHKRRKLTRMFLGSLQTLSQPSRQYAICDFSTG